MARKSFSGQQLFLNRHYSWLQFNERVLEEARDPANPLLERVKFLGITASNLDEFVEVRVAGLLQQVEHGIRVLGISTEREDKPRDMDPLKERLSRLELEPRRESDSGRWAKTASLRQSRPVLRAAES